MGRNRVRRLKNFVYLGIDLRKSNEFLNRVDGLGIFSPNELLCRLLECPAAFQSCLLFHEVI